jgi:hypothetical protein
VAGPRLGSAGQRADNPPQPMTRPDSPPPERRGLVLRDYSASLGSHAHDHFQVLIGLEGVLDI